jgi:hypothetical protein
MAKRHGWVSFVGTLALACAACGGGDAMEMIPEEPEEPSVPLGQYAEEATSWTVPVSGSAGGFYVATSSATEFWKLADIDGDLLPDLVHTADPTTSPRTVFGLPGNPHWRVYKNNGAGFDTIAIEWPVPATGELFNTTDSAGKWEFRDLNDDDLPDLVQTADPMNNKVWGHMGAAHWRVFRNTGTSFESSHQTWNIPFDPTPSGVISSTNTSTQLGAWALLDINADELPDLVRTAVGGNPLNVFNVASAPYWEVYANTGAGFASAQNWPVPLLTEPGFANGLMATHSLTEFATLDVDGDGQAEILITGDGEGEVPYSGGAPIWKLHARNGDAFAATASEWTVPNAVHADGFSAPNMSSNQLIWSTLDLDGDAKPDLVSTSNTTGGAPTVWGAPESPQWKMYRGQDSGFKRKAVSWIVPDNGLGDGFFSTANYNGNKSWLVVDLTGDGVAELVQTANPDATNEVFGFGSNPHWQVFAAEPGLLQLEE